MLTKRKLLFLTIMIEGYVVLAVELLAMRTLIPFVGSGTEVVAIVISAVLLPMAVGYSHGGKRFGQQYRRRRSAKILSIRQILLKNLLMSLMILTFGLSYVVQETFFLVLVNLGFHQHIVQTFLFCGIFLVYPVYLLAQTIPLLSNFFSSEHLSHVTGRMLFFSTVGSFCGSVFSTLVLMTTVGVHFTLVFTLSLLVLVMMLLTKRRYLFENIAASIFLLIAIYLNSPQIMKSFHIVADNQYSTTKVFDQTMRMDVEEALQHWKVLAINNSKINDAFSSAYSDSGQKIPVHGYIEKNLIPNAASGHKPLDILVMGAAGFALGMEDTYNHYVFVDIDPDQKKIAEKYFLPAPLQDNKRFQAMSARAFLREHGEHFDLIVLDLFSNALSFPQEAVTQDFLIDVKKHLNAGGIVASNIASSATYEDKFSLRYYNTFASVFPHASRQIIGAFDPWRTNPRISSLLYMYFDRPDVADTGVYTDDLNSYSLDK